MGRIRVGIVGVGASYGCGTGGVVVCIRKNGWHMLGFAHASGRGGRDGGAESAGDPPAAL